MAQAWPSGFQDRLNVESFQFAIGDTLIRSEMETGPKKVRRRFTKAIDKFSCSMTLTRSQYATFRNFYDVTLNAGSLPFTYKHPLTDVNTDFIFSKTPTLTMLGGTHVVLNMEWELKT